MFSLYFVASPSVLWYCWLGLLTCKNRLPYNLYCVGGDVKHCSLTHSWERSVIGLVARRFRAAFLAIFWLWSRYHYTLCWSVRYQARTVTNVLWSPDWLKEFAECFKWHISGWQNRPAIKMPYSNLYRSFTKKCVFRWSLCLLHCSQLTLRYQQSFVDIIHWFWVVNLRSKSGFGESG